MAEEKAIEKKQSTIPLSQLDEMGFMSGPAVALLKANAEFISKSTIIPKNYQGNIPNCAVAFNMAARMGADPIMVMQNLYPVYNRPSWSAQFLIATFNMSGDFSKLRYEWTEETDKKKDDFGCRAYAIELETGETLKGPWVTVGLARSEGWYDRKAKDGGGPASKWPTLTELMCMYRAAAFFIRTHCPEIAMGLRMTDEEEEIENLKNITDSSSILERTTDFPPPFDGERTDGVKDAAANAPEEVNSIPPDTFEETNSEPSGGEIKDAKELSEKTDRKAGERGRRRSGRTSQEQFPAYADTEPDPYQSGELSAERDPGEEG